ncbi:uncharacterized protein LOC144162800 [Haemaphysalis longicornis]
MNALKEKLQRCALQKCGAREVPVTPNAMYLPHILGLVVLSAGATAAADILDVTMLSRNFVYGPGSSPKFECYVPPGVSAHFGVSITEVPFSGVEFRPGRTNGAYVLDVPQHVFFHARTNLYWCDVHGSAISTVTSPAMYYDENDGPTFLPQNFTVTANVYERVTLRVQGAPGFDHVRPHVTSWAKVDDAAGTVSNTLATGDMESLTLRSVRSSDSGVYIASGPRFEAPGRNRAVMKLIVRRPTLFPRDCKNGGQSHGVTGQCICPPGFKGRLCGEACGDDRFGRNCTHKCSSTNPVRSVKSCIGILICLPDPYGCSCGTGFHGPFCNRSCPPHRYGADCKQSRVCHCETEPHCDIFTGTCLRDGGKCRRGWRDAPFCDKSYPIFNNGPSVTKITDQGAHVHFGQWSSTREAGMGTPVRYLVQYKEVHGMWKTETVSALFANNEYTVPLSGLRSNEAYDVRVLVVDRDGNYREDDAKTTHFRTECGAPRLPPQRVHIDSRSTNVIVVTWHTPAREYWLCGNVNIVLQMNGNVVERATTPGVNVYRFSVNPYTRVEIQLRLKTPNNKYSEWTPKFTATSSEDVPEAPENITLAERKEHSLKIKWDSPVQKNGALTGYKANLSLVHSFNDILPHLWPSESISLEASDHREVYFKNLSPGSTYLVCIEASTNAGFGGAVCQNFSTKASTSESPHNFRSTMQTEYSLRIRWDRPHRANGAIIGYMVNSCLVHTFNDVPEKSWCPNVVVQNVSATTEVYLRDLFPGSTYLVCAQANTIAGFGEAAFDNFTTKASVPGAPESLRTAEKTEYSLKVMWDPPRQKNGDLKSYKVNASLIHTFNDTLLDARFSTSATLDASDAPIISLPDLFPGSTYRVCVQASTIAGVGEAVCKNFSTKASVPVLQSEPIARLRGRGEVTIVVHPPDYVKGPITGYYVLVAPEDCNITEPVQVVNFTRAQEMQLGYYVAAYLCPSDLNGSPSEVVVGSGHMIGGFENPPLTKAVAYCFGLVVETNFSGEVLYGYSLTTPFILNSTSSMPSLAVIIGAISVFFLVVIAVATLTFCCLR